MTSIHTNHSFTLEDMSRFTLEAWGLLGEEIWAGRSKSCTAGGRGRQAQPRRPHQRARPCCRSGVTHAAADRRVAPQPGHRPWRAELLRATAAPRPGGG
jgi:hypothetical protein